jgi:regulator of protease activity HflC (stomatin/prohibitin superfamily)
MKQLRLVVLGLLAASLIGCTASTDATEVGVRTVNVALIGKQGVQDDIYPPGRTHFFFRPTSTWSVFDTAVQNLAMQGEDALRFKTIDGNDISVNVTIAWRVNPLKAPYLVKFVGGSTTEVGQVLVRPVARTIVRDVLNSLSSEEYYQAEKRFLMGEEAHRRLSLVLENEGIVVDQVLLGEHGFNQQYEQMIRDRKFAEQEASRLISATEAAREERKRDLEKAKGGVMKLIAEADGDAQKRKLEADAIYYERQQQAEAILAEKQARAEGLTERARALSGSGGRNMVKLEIARALQGKKIIFVPAGSGMDLRTTDVNDLLQVYGATTIANPDK